MLDSLLWQFNNTLDRYSYDVVLNGKDQRRVLFKEYMERTSTSDYKYILFKNGLIKQGDIISFHDDNWIVIHEDIAINNVYTKAIIRRLKHNIKFNFKGDIIEFPSAIDDGTHRVGGNDITLADGRIILHMQENEFSKQIKKEQRFLIMDSAFEVVQKTNAEHGIIKVYADVGVFSNDDDKENEIADRWKYETKNNYTIKINNIASDLLNLDDTLQLDVTATNNGEVVTVPITYTSSDNGVLAVDTEGLITGVGVGNATVTVAITDDLNVSDSITITVEEVLEPKTTYTITVETPYYNDDEDILSMGETYKYTVHKFDSGVEIDGEFTFELTDDSNAQITHTGKNLCDITAGNMIFGMSTTILKVTDIETGEIAIERLINVRGR